MGLCGLQNVQHSKGNNQQSEETDYRREKTIQRISEELQKLHIKTIFETINKNKFNIQFTKDEI